MFTYDVDKLKWEREERKKGGKSVQTLIAASLNHILELWDVYNFEKYSPWWLFWYLNEIGSKRITETVAIWYYQVEVGWHFEKTALKDVVILHIFLNRGLEMAKLPECFHGNKLDKGV